MIKKYEEFVNESMDYVGNCTHLDGQDVEDMVDQSTEVSAKEFRKNIGDREYKELEKDLGYGAVPSLNLESDYATSFYKSKYRGQPCYYLEHSAIEYIFV